MICLLILLKIVIKKHTEIRHNSKLTRDMIVKIQKLLICTNSYKNLVKLHQFLKKIRLNLYMLISNHNFYTAFDFGKK